MGLRARAFIESNHDYRHLALSSPAKWMRALPRRMKRLFDIVGSAAAIVLFHPALLGVAIAVRWSLGSPVLFRQWRPGLHGVPVQLLKFRTMTEDHDRRGVRCLMP